jgi:hypothetical protein
VKGQDLRCACGEGARDVAPDYELDPGDPTDPMQSMIASSDTFWTCDKGHPNCYRWIRNLLPRGVEVNG